jgi:protein-tyrosine phosphatase
MKILMVCLGNICRSPMAEGIMRKKLEDHGLKHTVDSTGTANYHVGEHPDPRAIEKARKYGIDISKLVGRQFTGADFDNFDVIYAMDSSNITNILRAARNANDKKKVKLIMDEVYIGQGMSVPDPFYGGDLDFENMYTLLDAACEKICKNLKEEK